MIFVDTSALVGSLTGKRRSAESLVGFLSAGERLQISSLVLYEWLRGPRTAQELIDRELILPSESIVDFGPAEAARAGELYKQMRRARSREVDLAIAATALVRDAALWTLKREDFRDIPDLRLV